MKIEKVSIDKLLLDPANARKHGKKNLDSIKGSLAKFGQQKPIVVNSDNVIVAGNGTLQAAKELGWKDINIVRTDLKGSDITAFGIADNRTSELAEWDDEVLKELLESLKAEDFDLSAIGFDDDEFAEMTGGKSKEGLTDPDEVPEPPKAPTTKLGDIWQLGNHRLMCGDSTDAAAVKKLMDGKAADIIFTSPPYNGDTSVGFAGSGLENKTLYLNNKSDCKTNAEYVDFNAKIFKAMSAIMADDAVVLYNINYNKKSPDVFIDVVNAGRQYFNLVETVIWEKSLAISLAGDNMTRIFEFIFVFYNGKGKPKMNKTHTNECVKNLWKISNVGANNDVHKACFPVRLVEYALEIYAKPNAVFYEPFGGSGTSVMASESLCKECRAMELDPKYCDVIIKRWEDFTGKKAVLINEN